MVRRFFEGLLEHRPRALAAIGALTLLLGFFAARVRPDFSVELLFPVYDQARDDYDRYKHDFPYEDAGAVVIFEAGDLWTPAGLGRVKALEKALARLDTVRDTNGITECKDIVAAGPEDVRVERLFPRTDLGAKEIADRRAALVKDPLFVWSLVPPSLTGTAIASRGGAAGVTSIPVMLRADAARSEDQRRRFRSEALAVLAGEERAAARAGIEEKLTLTGIPSLRPEYNELIGSDMQVLFPLVLAIILGLMLLTFHSIAITGATFLTISFSIVWTYGAMGLFGFPLQLLSSITPIVVMIISLSDTVHIVHHFRSAVGRGDDARHAIVDACAETAVACLLTEVVVACGFLTLLTVNITAIVQFGVAAAMGMMLTWVANMTVLPLTVDILRPAPRRMREDTFATRQFARFIEWIAWAVCERRRTIVAVTIGIVAVAVYFGSRVGTEYYLFDDLRPEGKLKRSIDYAERVHGGLVPLAVYIEPGAPAASVDEPMVEPAAIALMDRIVVFMKRRFPEAQVTTSAADLWRKTYRAFAPEEAAATGGLPGTRALAASLLTTFDQPSLVRSYLSPDRRSAAVVAMMPNIVSTRAREIAGELSEYLKTEEKATGMKLTMTALFGVIDDIYHQLVDGLFLSFGSAILVSFGVFCIVLRSCKLGLVGLVPNVLPMTLTFAFMGLAGISVKPSTVVLFSITLTISDDDTIQYLSRFREVFLRLRAQGVPDPHREAALATLRESGLPMFMTACTVALGFAALVFSSFLGLANLGKLIGASLMTAIFGDLFLSPLLLMVLKPRIGRDPAKVGAPVSVHHRPRAVPEA